jgi:hypothetical protein
MPKKEKPLIHLRPDVFNRKITELDNLKKDERDYVAKKLNDHLRSEILKKIGPEKPGILKLLDTIKLDYRGVKDSNFDTVVERNYWS